MHMADMGATGKLRVLIVKCDCPPELVEGQRSNDLSLGKHGMRHCRGPIHVSRCQAYDWYVRYLAGPSPRPAVGKHPIASIVFDVELTWVQI